MGQLVNSIIQEDLLFYLAQSIHLLPFESRKDTQTIFSYILRFKNSSSLQPQPPAVAYIVNSRPEVIIQLCRGYEHRESAMPCGIILREALKHEDIALIILYDEPDADFRIEEIDENAQSTGEGAFWQFFTWVDRGAFEVSTDAFTTLRVRLNFLTHRGPPLTSAQEILTRHKIVVAQYLTINLELFFSKYNTVLIQSSSYVTKRQSLKLLGEILLDRANYNIMTSYVDRGDHLKLCMNLLRDDRKMVQYEGFHVFKVGVARCPSMP